VDHAAAENLQPVFALAEADVIARAPALDVDFHRRRGEREEARTKTHRDLRHFKERFAEFLQHPFQIAHVSRSVDHQALDLMEHRRVRLIRIGAIGAAGADDADWRFASASCAPAPGWCGCVAALRSPFSSGGKKNVSCISRAGWPGGKVEHREIIIVALDVGPFGDRKAHIGENRDEFVEDLADRMDAPAVDPRLTRRQGHINGFGDQLGLSSPALSSVSFLVYF